MHRKWKEIGINLYIKFIRQNKEGKNSRMENVICKKKYGKKKGVFLSGRSYRG
jgi:hypothetical protein